MTKRKEVFAINWMEVEALVKGNPLPQPGIPESFRVLIKEFQALGLDISVINEDDKEVEFKELEIEENKEESGESFIEEISIKKDGDMLVDDFGQEIGPLDDYATDEEIEDDEDFADIFDDDFDAEGGEINA